MANNRQLSTNFWKDTYIVELDPSEKLIFNYLLTNPRTNIGGVYEINIREMAFDTGFDQEVVKRAIDKFQKDGKIIHTNGWLILRNWVKHQAINPSVRAGIERVIDNLPSWLSQFKIEDARTGVKRLDFDSLYTACNSLGTGTDILNYNLTITKLNLTKPNAIAELATLAKAKPAPIDPKVLDEVMDYWVEVVGYQLESELSNRRAIATLIRKHGLPQLKKLIDGVAQTQDDKYAPRIPDFVKLAHKVNDLMAWGRKRNKFNSVAEII